jgi:hypothetical protein
MGWTFSIGDPTFTGWIITLADLAAATLCLRAATAARDDEARFWTLAGILLLLLGLNKQLDLQTLLTELARQWAREGGWYQDRRAYQAIFVLMITLAGIAVVWKLRARFATSGRAVKGGLIGLTLTLLFVLVRAGSFHHLDEILHLEFMGARTHRLLEALGIIVLAASAFFYRAKHGSMGADGRSVGTTIKSE